MFLVFELCRFLWNKLVHLPLLHQRLFVGRKPRCWNSMHFFSPDTRGSIFSVLNALNIRLFLTKTQWNQFIIIIFSYSTHEKKPSKTSRPSWGDYKLLATLASENASKSGVLMESLRISGPPEQPSTRSLQAGGLLKHGALELNLAVSCAVENFSHFSRIMFFFLHPKFPKSTYQQRFLSLTRGWFLNDFISLWVNLFCGSMDSLRGTGCFAHPRPLLTIKW